MEDLLSLTAWLTPQYHVNIQTPPSTSLQSFALTLESEFARVYGLNDLRIAALQDRNHHDLPIEKNDMQVGLLLQNEDKVYVVLHPDGNPLQRKSPKNGGVSTSDTQSYLQAYFKLRLNIRPEDDMISAPPPSTTSRETEIIIQRLADVSKRISRNRGGKSDSEGFSSLLTSMSGQQKELLVKMGRTLTRDMARVLDCSPKGTSSPTMSDDVAEPSSPMFFFSKEDCELPRETCKKRKGSSTSAYSFTSPSQGFSPASPSISPTSGSPASALASAFSQRFFFPNSPASLSSQTSTTIPVGPSSPPFDFNVAKKQKKKKSSRAPLRITTAEVEAPPKIVFMKSKSPDSESPTKSPTKSPSKTKSPTKRGKGKNRNQHSNSKYNPKSPQATSPNSHLDMLVEVAQASQARTIDKRDILPLIST